MNLTPRQLDVAVAIRNHQHLHGEPPTFQELGDQLGVSKVTILEHVESLEAKGVVSRDGGRFRSLRLLDSLPDEERPTKLPSLGELREGRPVMPDDRYELDLESMFARQGGTYVLRIRGDSMIDDHLCDGDYVVIERTSKAKSGQHVVAVIDGTEATLKRYHKEAGGRVRLQPANKSMQPRVLSAERVRIEGVVIGVMRTY